MSLLKRVHLWFPGQIWLSREFAERWVRWTKLYSREHVDMSERLNPYPGNVCPFDMIPLLCKSENRSIWSYWFIMWCFLFESIIWFTQAFPLREGMSLPLRSASLLDTLLKQDYVNSLPKRGPVLLITSKHRTKDVRHVRKKWNLVSKQLSPRCLCSDTPFPSLLFRWMRLSVWTGSVHNVPVWQLKGLCLLTLKLVKCQIESPCIESLPVFGPHSLCLWMTCSLLSLSKHGRELLKLITKTERCRIFKHTQTYRRPCVVQAWWLPFVSLIPAAHEWSPHNSIITFLGCMFAPSTGRRICQIIKVILNHNNRNPNWLGARPKEEYIKCRCGLESRGRYTNYFSLSLTFQDKVFNWWNVWG